MVEEREDLILRMLRDIRETLNDHSRRLKNLTKSMEEVRESVITSLGFSAHANVQYRMVDQRLDDLTRRIEALEDAR